jgi:hypothetical protein
MGIKRRTPGMARRTEGSLRDQRWFRLKKLMKMAIFIDNSKVLAMAMIVFSSPP